MLSSFKLNIFINMLIRITWKVWGHKVQVNIESSRYQALLYSLSRTGTIFQVFWGHKVQVYIESFEGISETNGVIQGQGYLVRNWHSLVRKQPIELARAHCTSYMYIQELFWFISIPRKRAVLIEKVLAQYLPWILDTSGR